MRESKNISKLGKILMSCGFVIYAVSGLMNLNNLEKKGTPEYSISIQK